MEEKQISPFTNPSQNWENLPNSSYVSKSSQDENEYQMSLKGTSMMNSLSNAIEDPFRPLVNGLRPLVTHMFCKLCDVNFTKKSSVRQHMTLSPMHRSRLKDWFNHLRSIDKVVSESTRRFCFICNVNVFTKAHYDCPKHAKKLAYWWFAESNSKESFDKIINYIPTDESTKTKLLSLITDKYCHLCSKQLLNRIESLDHSSSKDHIKYIKVWLNINSQHELDSLERNAIKMENYQSLEVSIKEKLQALQTPNDCKVCMVSCSAPKYAMSTHFKSKKHKSLVRFWFKTTVAKIQDDYQVNWLVNQEDVPCKPLFDGENNEDLVEGTSQLDNSCAESVEAHLKTQMTIKFCYVCFKKLSNYLESKIHYASENHKRTLENWYAKEVAEIKRQNKTNDNDSNAQYFCTGENTKQLHDFCIPAGGSSKVLLNEKNGILGEDNGLQPNTEIMILNSESSSLMDLTFCGVCNEKLETCYHAELHYNTDGHFKRFDLWREKEIASKLKKQTVVDEANANQEVTPSLNDILMWLQVQVNASFDTPFCEMCNEALGSRRKARSHSRKANHKIRFSKWFDEEVFKIRTELINLGQVDVVADIDATNWTEEKIKSMKYGEFCRICWAELKVNGWQHYVSLKHTKKENLWYIFLTGKENSNATPKERTKYKVSVNIGTIKENIDDNQDYLTSRDLEKNEEWVNMPTTSIVLKNVKSNTEWVDEDIETPNPNFGKQGINTKLEKCEKRNGKEVIEKNLEISEISKANDLFKNETKTKEDTFQSGLSKFQELLHPKMNSLLDSNFCYICMESLENAKARTHYRSEGHRINFDCWFGNEISKMKINCFVGSAQKLLYAGIDDNEGFMNEKLKFLMTPFYCYVCWEAVSKKSKKPHYQSEYHKSQFKCWYKIYEKKQVNWRLSQTARLNKNLDEGQQKTLKDLVEEINNLNTAMCRNFTSILREKFLDSVSISSCQICGTKMNIWTAWQHYQSIKHKENVKKWHNKELADINKSEVCLLCGTNFYATGGVDVHIDTILHRELVDLVVNLIKIGVPIQEYWLRLYKDLIFKNACLICEVNFQNAKEHCGSQIHHNNKMNWIDKYLYYSIKEMPSVIDIKTCFCQNCDRILEGTFRANEHYDSYIHRQTLKQENIHSFQTENNMDIEDSFEEDIKEKENQLRNEINENLNSKMLDELNTFLDKIYFSHMIPLDIAFHYIKKCNKKINKLKNLVDIAERSETFNFEDTSIATEIVKEDQPNQSRKYNDEDNKNKASCSFIGLDTMVNLKEILRSSSHIANKN